MRRLLFLALGAAAVAYVVSRRRGAVAGSSENGSPRASSHDLRRAVGQARQRIEADPERA